MTTDVFPPGRWRARWIWAAPVDGAIPGGDGKRHTVALRRDLEVDTVPSSVPARVCADSRYVLWVNGTEVARGPARINPRRRKYDVIDIASALQPGHNTIAALCTHYGDATAWWLPAPILTTAVSRGGFLVVAMCVGDLVVSDDSWEGAVLAGWTALPPAKGFNGRGGESIDARSLPASWAGPGRDSPPWPAAIAFDAHSIGDPGRPEPPTFPHGPYGPNPLPQQPPRDVVLNPMDGGFTADQVVAGTLLVEASGPAGEQIRMWTSEFARGDEPGGDSAVDPAGGGVIGFSMTLDGTTRAVESVDIFGLRDLHIDDVPESVTINRVVVRERTYPVEPGAEFSCSDPVLDQIWAVGRRTVSLCSFDAYIDCPTREQRAWIGDSVVHQMVDLTTNLDWRLARWYPYLAASPRPDGMLPMAVAGDAEHYDIAVIPDWALHWVHGVHNLYRYLGDEDEIRRLLPVVEGVLRWFEPFVDAHGTLVDVPGWVIIDWSSIYTEGVSAGLNGLWGRALLEFAEMSEWLGDAGRAGWARGVHQRLAAGFERLWDAERQRYVDSYVERADRPMASQHGQAVAIVGGLAPADRYGVLVERLIDSDALIHANFAVPDGPALPGTNVAPGGAALRAGHTDPWWDIEREVVRAQPFFRYVVHDALVQAGRADLVVSQCREWAQLLEICPTSWSETWFGGTVSHGWSSTPTRDLMTRVLGVTPATPGFSEASITPNLGGLKWAKGRVPSPHGLISVDVTAERLDVDSPIPFVHDGNRYAAGNHSISLSAP
jgi:hypothetical protein